MLKKITLCKTSCYGDTPQHLDDLRKINIIYGENGAGKSTIARLIQNDSHPDFSESCIEWQDNTPVKALIYNKLFIDETLKETNIPGVFTLGKEAVNITNTIIAKKDESKSLSSELVLLSKNLQKNQKLLDAEGDKFTEHCWKIKKKYDTVFSHAFTKLNKSKPNFSARCIEAIPESHPHNYTELINEAAFLFAPNPPKIAKIPAIDTHNLHDIENPLIFKQKIIGKDDVDISQIIDKLGNSDWVQQGMSFFFGQECPFCHQMTPAHLRQQLEDYFDDTYRQKTIELQNQYKSYTTSIEQIIEQVITVFRFKHDLLKLSDISSDINSIKDKFRNNSSAIELKIKEPSKIIEIQSIHTHISNIQNAISEINTSIDSYNSRIDNIQEEKSSLTTKIWQFIGHEASPFYEDYRKRVHPAQKEIESMYKRNKELNTSLTNVQAEILNLETQVSSITPSKVGINKTLKLYGFDNFELEDSDNGNYKIKRSDGSYANETLSEGERTFITFLYFNQLIQGSITQKDIASSRVIIFDDPVSSLDSKVLFVVSSLIRNLFSNDEMQRLDIKQIFILTHNVYFHKEVAFLQNIRHLGTSPLKPNDFSFWIIRRKEGISIPTYYPKNPIKTNYHLLWQELKNCTQEGIYTLSTCNIMRRILENYFKILGGQDLHQLANNFDGEEKIVIRSLTSWINDGSHFAHESIDIGIGTDLSDHYLTVFRKIFERTGHLPHYDMMMNSC